MSLINFQRALTCALWFGVSTALCGSYRENWVIFWSILYISAQFFCLNLFWVHYWGPCLLFLGLLLSLLFGSRVRKTICCNLFSVFSTSFRVFFFFFKKGRNKEKKRKERMTLKCIAFNQMEMWDVMTGLVLDQYCKIQGKKLFTKIIMV